MFCGVHLESGVRCALLTVLTTVAMLAVLTTPAQAQNTGVLLSCTIDGKVSEADQVRLIKAVETGLAGGETPNVLGVEEARGRLSSVAPEVVGCFTAGCLTRAGQALDTRVGYRANIKEEFEIYAISVTAYSLVDGSKLAAVEGACEICTTDEASATASEAATQVRAGWSYPAAAASDPLADRSDDKAGELVVKETQPDPPAVKDPKTPPAGPTVRVALYAEPLDAAIAIDGQAVGTGKFVGTLKAGTHTVTLERSGFGTVTEQIDLRDGDGPTYVVIHMRPTEQAGSPSGRSGGLVEQIEREPWAWGLTGGGALMTIAGGILLGIDGEPTCKGDTTACPEIFDTGAGGAIMFGAGIATLTAGVALFLWDDLAGESPSDLALGVGIAPEDEGALGIVTLGGRF